MATAEIVTKVEQQLGPITLLINNAGQLLAFWANRNGRILLHGGMINVCSPNRLGRPCACRESGKFLRPENVGLFVRQMGQLLNFTMKRAIPKNTICL